MEDRKSSWPLLYAHLWGESVNVTLTLR
jgi:hypothetical protein